ncbi:Protein of unknown function [Cotesia congregata]|uniref:Uncharacterized protein n=1 Tax=Cotesia congregata TaxID=51543 RepID=A0A8J2HLH9_COTCN|nr:Protein of unknown function [Cotesia congregata]
MHCVPFGICWQFFKLWFDSRYYEKDFYLGTTVDEIDELLLSFRPSMNVSRTPRRISDQAHFKAHELVIWLLSYSLAVLNKFLPSKYVYHWSLLVEAISLLLKT